MKYEQRLQYALKANIVRVGALVTSTLTMPARQIWRAIIPIRTELYAVSTLSETPNLESGIALLERALALIEADVPLWLKRYKHYVKHTMLVQTVKAASYCVADRTLLFNPWTALVWAEQEVYDLLNAAFLITAVSKAHFLVGKKRGAIGIIFSTRLALKAALRFLERAYSTNRSPLLLLLIREWQKGIPYIDQKQ